MTKTHYTILCYLIPLVITLIASSCRVNKPTKIISINADERGLISCIFTQRKTLDIFGLDYLTQKDFKHLINGRINKIYRK